jgi:type I restriction enzyme, S subunit
VLHGWPGLVTRDLVALATRIVKVDRPFSYNVDPVTPVRHPHDEGVWLGNVATLGTGIEFSPYAGCVSSAYVALIPSDSIEPQFFRHLLKSKGYIAALQSTSNLVRDGQALRYENFTMVPIPLCPLAEQRTIARFLDRETSKIDALIAKQEQLIATLREDRTATITHAVTKGLDPNVEMQDSGVELLGAVPAHWRQTQLRHIVDRIEQGVSPQAHAELADEGWGVLKSGCVNGGVFADVQHKKLPDGFEIDPAIIVKEGDLVVCRASGSPDLVGSTAVVRQLRYQLILSDKTFRLRPGSLTSPDYLEWAMNSRMYREQVRRAISGAEGLANNLPMSALKTFRLTVPPRSEQNHIVADLKERCGKIDSLIAKATEVIETIREYRSALITDAVTGKIDVRGAA